MAGTSVEDEQFEISFCDDSFIKVFGLGAHNVLDYFSLSGFYDKTCNNEICKMQRLDPTVSLSKMKGIEYVLIRTEHEPQLFVIVKQDRKSETQVVKLAMYYILDKCVYQAPNIYSLINSRLYKAAYHLNETFDFISRAKEYSLTKGYTWNFNIDSNREKEKWNTSGEEISYQNRENSQINDFKRKSKSIIDSILIKSVKQSKLRQQTKTAEPPPAKKQKQK